VERIAKATDQPALGQGGVGGGDRHCDRMQRLERVGAAREHEERERVLPRIERLHEGGKVASQHRQRFREQLGRQLVPVSGRFQQKLGVFHERDGKSKPLLERERVFVQHALLGRAPRGPRGRVRRVVGDRCTAAMAELPAVAHVAPRVAWCATSPVVEQRSARVFAQCAADGHVRSRERVSRGGERREAT
jgi:hypothetical protein